ncbi:HpcH/HpaI aldolase/citrate lyase family protein [Tepidamorphus sp. 3E244]|uniref:HpcH/HpaI aldolase/citrate lyase family protein n=1 Tax=Tepidamorphus sp. 3E244 TaxID=3385498 RepID=UPI0038FCAB67
MSIRPRRSVLYMPGSNARALEKAKTLDADALILDLEDAVAPDAKEIARSQVCEAVKAGGYGHRELVIRINGLDTAWGRDDLAAAVDAAPDAILAPKVSSASDIFTLTGHMGHAPRSIKLWAMMETPLGMLNAGEVAATAKEGSARLSCFVMGTNDLAKETGARLDNGRRGMVGWLSICVAAACAHGLSIIDGVYNDFKDEDGLIAECEHGRDFGMDGKTLIHPGQIAAANCIFAPSEAEVADARTVIEAFEQPENAGKGAINLNGRMVERMHADMAKRTVQLAEAISGRGGAA